MLLSKEEILSRAIPIGRLMDVEKANVIYFLIKSNEIIYIGQSVFPAGRFSHHKAYKCRFESYSFVYVDDLEERLDLESDYIDQYKPIFNGENRYRQTKEKKEKEELIRKLKDKFDSVIIIGKDKKYNKIYYDTNTYDIIGLLREFFSKYSAIKNKIRKYIFSEPI